MPVARSSVSYDYEKQETLIPGTDEKYDITLSMPATASKISAHELLKNTTQTAPCVAIRNIAARGTGTEHGIIK